MVLITIGWILVVANAALLVLVLIFFSATAMVYVGVRVFDILVPRALLGSPG